MIYWLNIYIVYKTVPPITLPLPGSPPSQDITADYIPSAALLTPMTVYQLLIRTS